MPDRVKPVICNFWHPGTLTLSAERQSAQMSKITHDGLTRSGTGCLTAVSIWQQWASKGCSVKTLEGCTQWEVFWVTAADRCPYIAYHMLFHRSVMRLVVGCADMEVARHHQMTAERVFDITTVTCNSTGERWHFVCRRGEWYGAPLTNCTSGQHTYTYRTVPQNNWPDRPDRSRRKAV